MPFAGKTICDDRSRPAENTRSWSALVAMSTSVSLVSTLPRGSTPTTLLKVPPASTATAVSSTATGSSFTAARMICRLSWSLRASARVPGVPSLLASPKLPWSLLSTVRVSVPLKLALPR
ncbi:hypothetical protein D9M71_229050 [compost metagenome]